MVSNLEKAEAEKQATIAELEDYMKNHLGDAVEIKAKITATRKELWDVRDKLNDKKMKLELAKLQLDELQKNTSHIDVRIIVESQGGSDTKDCGREKDEDEIGWIRRCLRQATWMVKPRRGKGLNR